MSALSKSIAALRAQFAVNIDALPYRFGTHTVDGRTFEYHCWGLPHAGLKEFTKNWLIVRVDVTDLDRDVDVPINHDFAHAINSTITPTFSAAARGAFIYANTVDTPFLNLEV